MSVKIITGDCRTAMAVHGPFDLLIADPPYGDTSLDWDVRSDSWIGYTRKLHPPETTRQPAANVE